MIRVALWRQTAKRGALAARRRDSGCEWAALVAALGRRGRGGRRHCGRRRRCRDGAGARAQQLLALVVFDNTIAAGARARSCPSARAIERRSKVA